MNRTAYALSMKGDTYAMVEQMMGSPVRVNGNTSITNLDVIRRQRLSFETVMGIC